MFTSVLEDLEVQREKEAKLAGKSFKAAIQPPYRWREVWYYEQSLPERRKNYTKTAPFQF